MLDDARDLVRIDGSRLSNRFGRYKGALLTNITVQHQAVADVITKYKQQFNFEIAKVMYHLSDW
jgi:hypothetical protein